MSNSEINEIIASVQAAISRAYALGRLDALKHVITAIETEETGLAGTKPLALQGPRPSEVELPHAAAPVHEPATSEQVASRTDLPANDDRVGTRVAESDQLPWYRRVAE